MKNFVAKSEPMCETSEPGERLMIKEELLPASLEIGRRIMEVFGYQSLSAIVFRLKSTSDEIRSIINGEKMPSAELLLGIQRITGASTDWLLTGDGPKYTGRIMIKEGPYDSLPLAVLGVQRERQQRLYIQSSTQ
jgi:hypothetical protein